MPRDIIRDCSTLYNACESAGDLVAKMRPEVVVLITPHGLALTSGSYAVYMAEGAQGNALWNNCFQEIELKIPLDTQLSGQLLQFLKENGHKSDGVITFSRMESPLRWGEVVPLWFVHKKVDSTSVKYIIVSFGRNGEGFEDMGRTLHKFSSIIQQRMAVVISGDLAHTHETNCAVPLYLPDRRWDLQATAVAEEFDWSCEMQARGIPYSEDTEKGSSIFEDTHPWSARVCFAWLQRVIEHDPVAKSCGRKGFQILQGVLEKENETGGTVTSHFLARCAPTYYGMMTVVFDINKSVV